MKKILLFLFLSISLFAQAEYVPNESLRQFSPKFYIDLAGYKSQDPSKSKLDVFIKVSNSNVQFLKTRGEYRAKYSLTISVYDDDDILKFEKLWNENITTKNFKQTISQTSFNVSYKSFIIEPGEYKFICRLEDSGSRKYSVFERMINIRGFNDSIDISDLVIASKFVETVEGTKIIPNISNQVTSQDSTLLFFYEIYTDIPKNVKVTYSINNIDGQPLFIKNIDLNLSKGMNEINATLDKIVFSLGSYQLAIKILDNRGNIIKGTIKIFSSRLFGFPPSINDLDLAIEQMQYIASPSDIEEIENAVSYSQKLKNYIDYWKKLDPSPNTVENETLNEYYHRVEYAEANFDGFFKGWKSDMGMVYITLGPPDQVTRRPNEMDSKPYEIWDYYFVNKSFIFVDETSFGNYRLENPTYGGWFRYRP